MTNDHNALESVKAAFEHWRRTRAKQGKIPDELWLQVKALLGQYPLTTICNSLKISHLQIKEKLEKETCEPQFIEVANPLPIEVAEAGKEHCSIELNRPSGESLKIHTLPMTMIPQIISDFMRL